MSMTSMVTRMTPQGGQPGHSHCRRRQESQVQCPSGPQLQSPRYHSNIILKQTFIDQDEEKNLFYIVWVLKTEVCTTQRVYKHVCTRHLLLISQRILIWVPFETDFDWDWTPIIWSKFYLDLDHSHRLWQPLSHFNFPNFFLSLKWKGAPGEW